MRLTAELLIRHVLSPRMTHSAIGSESCNVREMFTAPYSVVVFPPSLNALYFGSFSARNLGISSLENSSSSSYRPAHLSDC
jgi:hypothetical protein